MLRTLRPSNRAFGPFPNVPKVFDSDSLPFDTIYTRFLIATNRERNQHASRERDERNRVQTFEGHDTRIIDDSALWPKGWLDALVSLISFTGFTDSSNSQLGRKFIGGTQFAIHQLLQLKLVGCLFCKGNFRHMSKGCIKGVHRVNQGAVLIFSWCKLQKHRLFHVVSIALLKDIVKGQESTTTLAPKKERLLPPLPFNKELVARLLA